MKNILTHAISCLILWAGTITNSTQAEDLYFPPARTSEQSQWATVEPSSVGWDKTKLQKALDYAGAHQSSGMVILYRGKILGEQHWKLTGPKSAKFKKRILGRTEADHTIEDVASAQKSIASFLVGIAQQKGLLKIDDPVNQYLKAGWSRATPEQEQAIKIRHLITMTSGLSVRGNYETKPGTKWLYNTAVYAKSIDVVAAAAKMDRHELTRKWLTGPIGMADSKWASRGAAGIAAGNGFGFATSARDLARFGLLALAGGKWAKTDILSDRQYLKESTTSSQKLNPYYGYLWWLNRSDYGPKRIRRIAAAPADMFSANGALNRRCFVVPSLDLVVTRLGDQPDVGKAFDRQFWKLLAGAAPR
jgi:CubicO group peptidase (beta-lactamase class C family)